MLAVTILGAILLVLMRGYYIHQERIYLEQNAPTVSNLAAQLMEVALLDDSLETNPLLQSQVNTISFLTQTRIRVLDMEDRLIVESDAPEELQASATLALDVQVGEAQQFFSQTLNNTEPGQKFSSTLIMEGAGTSITTETNVQGNVTGPGGLGGLVTPLSLLQSTSFFGPGISSDQEIRSKESVRNPIEKLDGTQLGFVTLSHGPAFGRAIQASVVWGVGIAGSIAVVLATFVGWAMSLRLTRPILGLAEVTEGMAAGDLTLRAQVTWPEEVGQLAHSFNLMAARIESIVRTLRRFVADATHELNTPLTALRTNLDLASYAVPENVHLANAKRQVLRLQKLSDDLLDLSRLESGSNTKDYRPVNLTVLLQKSSEPFAASAEQTGLHLRLRLPEDPVRVKGNRDHLHRAVENLLDNAVKFTPVGGVVTLRLSVDHAWARVSIEDNGIGIPLEEIPLVFGRFHRGRNAADYPGSGLGLAIVKAIVDAHGGDISVSSDASGTIFCFKLPVLVNNVETLERYTFNV
jgi:signal transduction histidine kinase